jgi:hypothetical protein
VNVCFPYTSTEELAAALAHVRAGLGRGALLPADVDAGLLVDAMHTRPRSGTGSPQVDLLLRTSGEERLSDFLLWQSGGALLTWLPVLWPQLGFLDLLRALRAWQEARPTLCALARAAAGGAARGCSPLPEQGVACSGGDGDGGAPCRVHCSCHRHGDELATAAAAVLTSICEEAPTCAPHPSKQLRAEGFLEVLEAARQDWIDTQIKRFGGGECVAPTS